METSPEEQIRAIRRLDATNPTDDVFGFGLPNGSVHLWHTKSSKPIGKAINIGSQANLLSACPDGSGYIGAPRDHRPVMWKHLGPRTGSPAELKTWVENITGITLDANDELTAIDPVTLHERRAKQGG